MLIRCSLCWDCESDSGFRGAEPDPGAEHSAGSTDSAGGGGPSLEGQGGGGRRTLQHPAARHQVLPAACTF